MLFCCTSLLSVTFCCCIVLLCDDQCWILKSWYQTWITACCVCVAFCVLCVVCSLKMMLFSIHSFRSHIYSPFLLSPLPFSSPLLISLSPFLLASRILLSLSLCTVLNVFNVFSFILLSLNPFCSCEPTTPFPTEHIMFLRVYMPPSTTPLERRYVLVLNLLFISKIILSFREKIQWN